MIDIQNLSKSFNKHQVLNQIDLKVNPSEIVGLIGPSGSGKSTIIKLALGMEKADGGEAKIFGKTMPQRKILNEIGYMAQNDALYMDLTGQENLKFFAQMKGVAQKNIASEIKRVSAVVDLTKSLNLRVSNYSGGMQRRLSLAIALLDNPKLLILDEPTVGIDPALRIQIWAELNKLKQQGRSVLVTTHVMDEAEKVDKVALILNGKVMEFDSPADLKQKYAVDTVEEVFLKAEGAK